VSEECRSGGVGFFKLKIIKKVIKFCLIVDLVTELDFRNASEP
jgi:hypothetical protein